MNHFLNEYCFLSTFSFRKQKAVHKFFQFEFSLFGIKSTKVRPCFSYLEHRPFAFNICHFVVPQKKIWGENQIHQLMNENNKRSFHLLSISINFINLSRDMEQQFHCSQNNICVRVENDEDWLNLIISSIKYVQLLYENLITIRVFHDFILFEVNKNIDKKRL